MAEKHIGGLIEHNERLNRQTMEYLQEALILLLEEKDFHEISVTELCAKAGVSRRAFYSHYKTKELLYEQIVRTLNKEMVDIVGSPFNKLTGEKWYQNFFELMKENATTVKTVFNADRDRYLAAINYVVLYTRALSPEQRYVRLLWTGGIVNATVYWIESGMDIPAKDMADLCFRTLNPVLSGYPN